MTHHGLPLSSKQLRWPALGNLVSLADSDSVLIHVPRKINPGGRAHLQGCALEKSEFCHWLALCLPWIQAAVPGCSTCCLAVWRWGNGNSDYMWFPFVLYYNTNGALKIKDFMSHLAIHRGLQQQLFLQIKIDQLQASFNTFGADPENPCLQE